MEFLDVPLFDDDIFKLLVRFGINLCFLTLIVVFAIYPNQRTREFVFTAVMLNVVVFFICFTMKKLQLDLGLALGLFAVFAVLRYRTETLTAKEMTYLFIAIGIAVINSLSNTQTSYAEIALVNGLIFAAAMLKEWMTTRSADLAKAAKAIEKANSKSGATDREVKAPKLTVEYDRLEWLGESHRETVLNDLKARTGMDITSFEVKSIDLVQNKATLTIWKSR